jgi:tetraprenyl-beta-curcumene synthase
MLAAPPPQAARATRTGTVARARERIALAAAFARLAVRYWLTVYPHVIAHMHRARRRARSIPDPALRGIVLASLAKRSNIEGAAAFAALVPRRTRATALKALLAFQSIYNYADVLAEQPTIQSVADAHRAHMPLACALGAGPPIADLYACGEWTKDTGYLADLIVRCRSALAELPGAALVRASLLSSARDIAEFQAHSRPAAEPGELERWARGLPPRAPRISWWESAAACGSSLAVHALIAAAAERSLDERTVRRLIAAYGGPVGALHSLLDSLIDQDEDALLGQPSLIALYPSAQAAAHAMGEMADSAMLAGRALPHGRRHAVLVAAMSSLYLSDPQARTPRAAPMAASARAGIGALATPAMGVFALRRLTAPRGMQRASARARAYSARAEPAEPEQPADVCARAV